MIKIEQNFIEYLEELTNELKQEINGKPFNKELAENPIFGNTFNFEDDYFDFNYKDISGMVHNINGLAKLDNEFTFYDRENELFIFTIED